MTTSYIIISACWWIFIIVWLINAAYTKRTVEKQSAASMLAHRIPVGLGWWLMLVPKWHSPLDWQILPHTEFLQIIGAAICVYGLIFTLWARHTLAGNWSADVTFKQNHELIRTGPYRFVRHPIYTGLLIMWIGTALAVGQLRCTVSVLLVAIGFWIKIRQEERLMIQHFPDAYPAYRREVKALVPFVI